MWADTPLKNQTAIGRGSIAQTLIRFCSKGKGRDSRKIFIMIDYRLYFLEEGWDSFVLEIRQTYSYNSLTYFHLPKCCVLLYST